METTNKKTSKYGEKDFTRDEEIFKEEIEPRMKELIQLNDHKTNDFEKIREISQRQNKLMDQLKHYCRKANAMTGRIIKFPQADSYAFYLVVKVYKTKCRLQWINHMDGWIDSRLGEKGSLDIDFVHSEIYKEDRLNELFS
jgi:hypothetical protein